MNVLTFDLGTTLFKIAVFDTTGRMLALKRMPPGVAEGRWTNDSTVIERLLHGAVLYLQHRVGEEHFRAIRRISFATQANSFVLLDARGDALTPMIFWPDNRAAGEEIALSREVSADDLHRVAGIPRLSQHMTIVRLRWLARDRPGILTRARQLQFLSDALTYSFTGQHVTEAGVAALSGLLDIERCDWWPRAIKAAGIHPRILPKVLRTGTNLGPILPEVADALGLSRECEFVLGCLDQYAGAIGTGATQPGDVCETTGTVLAAVRASDHRGHRPGVFEGPGPAPERFWQMTFSGTSANLLEWYRSTLPDKPGFDEISRDALTAPSAAPIEPYEEGMAISHCFRHVRPEHTRGQIVRGIFERVATTLKLQIESLCGSDRPVIIRSAGGGAKSRAWLDIKSRIVGIPCAPVECEEPTSLGAARLAMQDLTPPKAP